jgi:Tfp pilus assembly protein FimT
MSKKQGMGPKSAPNGPGGISPVELRGISLVEAVLGIVVIAIMAGLAFAVGSALLDKRRQDTAISQVYGIVQGARDLYRGQPAPVQAAAAGTAAMLGGNAISGEMSNDGITAFNDWGGAVTVSTTNADFTITYAGLPQTSCTGLALKIVDPGQAIQTGLLGVSLNGGAEIGQSAFPLTPGQAGSGCNANGTSNNSVAWRFAFFN